MHELYELRDKLCKELKAYSKKEVSASALTMVDTLAHAIKNLDKVIECDESEEQMYSGRPAFESGSMRGSYDDGMGGYSRRSMSGSYARGRMNARRDSMGRYSGDGYSGHGDAVSQLEDLMRNAPDEMTRQKIQSILSMMD
jgi:hypothetical protein